MTQLIKIYVTFAGKLTFNIGTKKKEINEPNFTYFTKFWLKIGF